ncbi:hypothetical protein F4775DRAFT_602491 [Biscogniauxia sp. FL1348]|nr:hypothetical protein F4775DRAFT_602491 [Biscogniauxia sp. FL1348]
MDKLPQEIVDHIVSYLPQVPRTKILETRSERRQRHIFARYAAVSRKFQLAIEPRTFRTFIVISDNEQLRQCFAILNPRRLSYVREIRYFVLLPQGKQVIYTAYERPDEQAVNNQEFTLAMKHLFRILQPQGEAAKAGKGINLCIRDIVSPSDEFLQKALPYRRHQRSRIRLLMKPEDLPLLPNVSHLLLMPARHLLHPRVAIDIASRLPNLEAMQLTFDAREFLYHGLVLQDRQSLADAIGEHLEALKRIKQVALLMEADGGPINQAIAIPSCLCDLGYDPLGSAMRRWALGIEYTTIQGSYDGTLFWPHSSEPEYDGYSAIIKQSKMKRMLVTLERYTPSGWWYFMPTFSQEFGDRDADKARNALPPRFIPAADPTIMEVEGFTGNDIDLMTEECLCQRTVPLDETMEPLVESWARALQWMPELEQALLSFGEQNNGEVGRTSDMWRQWSIIYRAPGMAYDELGSTPEGKRSRRLEFHNVGDWKPRSSTMEMLREAGKRAHEDSPLIVMRDDVVVDE